MKKILLMLAMVLVVSMVSLSCQSGSDSKGIMEDKSENVVTLLQNHFNRPENTGGKVSCEARRIGLNLVQCDLHYVSGMSNLDVIANTKGIAEMCGEVGLAATVYFAGWRGNLKICEYQYDIYSRTVTRVK